MSSRPVGSLLSRWTRTTRLPQSPQYSEEYPLCHLGGQIHPTPRVVRTRDTLPPRCFSADYTKLTKVKCHWPWFTLISAHTSNLYRAVMQCARASARHNQLLTHAGPGPLGVSGESAHCGCTGSAHRCRRFNDTNLSLALRVGIIQEPFFYITQMESFLTIAVCFQSVSYMITRSTEGLSAPSARYVPEYSPLPSESYRTFLVGF